MKKKTHNYLPPEILALDICLEAGIALSNTEDLIYKYDDEFWGNPYIQI